MSGVTALMKKPAELSLGMIYSVCFVQFKLLSVLWPRLLDCFTAHASYVVHSYFFFIFLFNWLHLCAYFCVLHFSFYLRVNEDVTDFCTWCKYSSILSGFDHFVVYFETIPSPLFYFIHCWLVTKTQCFGSLLWFHPNMQEWT